MINLLEIHQVEFPFVKEWHHNHEFDHVVILDYHSLLCTPVNKKIRNLKISKLRKQKNKNAVRPPAWIESNSTWRKLFSTPLVYSLNFTPFDNMFATT